MTTTKTAIVIFSDPKNGGEEALGRVFNALAAALDFKNNGDDVKVLFMGTGTRWLGELADEEHPAHGLFKEVEDKIAGASSGCADFFGAKDGVEKAGCQLVTGNPIPGTSGLASLRALATEGFHVITF